jgi:hypothetical protein
MKLFTDLLCWIAAHVVVFWWERENRNTPHRCDAGREGEPLPHQEARRPDPEKEPGLFALWEADQKEQADHAQNPEHPFFLEWQRAEEERRIDEWIRRALNSE